MTRLATFRRTLREQRVPVAAWSVALVALGFAHIIMFPQYKEAASVLDQNAYYRALAGAAGGLGTPAGYLNAEYFTGAPLLVLIYAIIAGTGIIASEQASGTLEMLLAQPVRRSRILLEKAAALACCVGIVAIASLPGLLLGMLVVDFDISPWRLAAACVAIVPMVLLYAAIAILGSALLGTRVQATTVVIGAALIAFFLNAFGGFADVLSGPRKLSPFYWTDYSDALTGTWDWPSAGLLLLSAAAVTAVTAVLFDRRDIGTSSRLAMHWNWRPGSRPGQVAQELAALGAAPGSLPTFWRTLREQRTQFTSWAAVVFILAFVTVAIYPQFKDALVAFDESGAFAELAGESGGISSPAGYLNLEFFSYVPLLVLIAAVIAGTGALAGEEVAGTLDLVLAQPVSRRRVLLEKVAALALLLALTAIISIPGLVLAALIVDFDLRILNLALSAVYIIPLTMLFLSLAIFAGAALANRTAATMLVVGAAIAAYFLNTIGSYVDSLEQARKFSPFYWADFSRVLLNGFDYVRAGMFLGIAVGLVVAALAVFERRDIGVAGVAFRLRRIAR